MAILCLKGYLFLWPLTFPRYLEMIEFPIEHQDTATGARGKLNPYLLQCCTDKVFSPMGRSDMCQGGRGEVSYDEH